MPHATSAKPPSKTTEGVKLHRSHPRKVLFTATPPPAGEKGGRSDSDAAQVRHQFRPSQLKFRPSLLSSCPSHLFTISNRVRHFEEKDDEIVPQVKDGQKRQLHDCIRN
uniref:Uncharacterized protein n=1 Tax=Oryza meridionalis TaxID=40149 RepID=A0A0E0EGB0_9ORYZ